MLRNVQNVCFGFRAFPSLPHLGQKNLSCSPALFPKYFLANGVVTRKAATMGLIRGCQPERIRILNSELKNGDGKYVLYWVRTSLRVSHNPTLQLAVQKANDLSLPLRAVYTMSSLAEDRTPHTERHAQFLLESLKELGEQFRNRLVPFAVVSETHPAKAMKHFAADATHVFTDAAYLELGRAQEREVENELSVPMIVVEANIVVPVETASEKVEHAARTIRPKINSRLDRFLTELDESDLRFQDADKALDTMEWAKQSGSTVLDVADIDSCTANIPDLDSQVKPVTRFIGGESKAQETLKRFLNSRIRDYAKGRNEPAKELQSDISPYLRIGCISPVTVALDAKRLLRGASAGMRESVEAFLEELIVRRELAINMCWFAEKGYAVYEETVPQYAQISLKLHKSDPRPWIYSYEQLEAGATHDPFWNAAQRELVVTGKMQSYMRMYWAKQVIGWIADPKTAMEHTLRLNNRWGLDAPDPNSYAGVIWCYGRHDQGWKEREIWGKVRYMNEAGLRRKFDMGAYVAKINALVEKHGLPEHLRDVEVPSTAQPSVKDMLKRKATGSSRGRKRGKRASKES